MLHCKSVAEQAGSVLETFNAFRVEACAVHDSCLEDSHCSCVQGISKRGNCLAIGPEATKTCPFHSILYVCIVKHDEAALPPKLHASCNSILCCCLCDTLPCCSRSSEGDLGHASVRTA